MIYFIKSEGGLTNIGHVNKNIKIRLTSLQNKSHTDLTLVGVMPGNLKVLMEIHRRFAKDFIYGEWFDTSAEITDFIINNTVDSEENLKNYRQNGHDPIIGNSIRKLRVLKNISQETLSIEAGVEHSQLVKLENSDRDAHVNTLVKVAKALGRQDWLNNLAPQISINPLHMVRGKSRKRAKRKAK